MGIQGVAGILFDLGVSSLQLDDLERGFSYSKAAPLDMRMDKSKSVTASSVINEYSQEELTRIIKVYGEERFANRIAKNIVKARGTRKLENTAHR
jgi:16S rRNA (cytosine1402-N4)-methyltransferase